MKNVNLLLIIVSMMIVAACKSGGGPDHKANVPLKNTRWVIETLNGDKVELPKEDREIFIVFQSNEPRFHGMAGCNNIGGAYELEGKSSLKFGKMMSTMMFCEHMQIEDALTSALEMIDSYKIEGQTLHLIAAGKTVISFKEAPMVE